MLNDERVSATMPQHIHDRYTGLGDMRIANISLAPRPDQRTRSPMEPLRATARAEHWIFVGSVALVGLLAEGQGYRHHAGTYAARVYG
jgi:hypothetical protein